MTNDIQLTLRKTTSADLEQLFIFQQDEEANYLAAFTAKDQPDLTAYLQKFTKFLSDPTINMFTIWMADTIVGSIAKYEMHGEAHITYWIDKQYWGRGVATNALTLFLTLETTRPLFGAAAFDNLGSQKVMEKCGFVKVGTDKGFANARQAEIEEVLYKLTV